MFKMAAIIRHLTLAAVIAAALVAFGCGDDDGGPETPGASSSQAATSTAAGTAVPPTDERLQEILEQPGLLQFLRDLEDAIEANDVQFLLDRTHFAEYECQSTGGFPAEPEECWGEPGLTVLAVGYSFWQSEGGYWTKAAHEEVIRDRLTGPDADGAGMYAIGQMTLGDEESPDVADVVIDGVGGLEDLEPTDGMAMSLEIAERDGEWVITEFAGANTALVPDFYDWWAVWEDFTSLAPASP